ncbi:PilZ domain-containing protein [Myxococcota bacterium]|nr:PilZ domain-containing protein [Myxococcota bacterium]
MKSPDEIAALKALILHFRVPLKEITAAVKVGSDTAPMMTTMLTNLSTRGVYLQSSKPFTQGTSVEVYFQLPGVKDKLQVKGIVRWIGSSSQALADSEAVSGMGIEFTSISSGASAVIHGWVEQYLETHHPDEPSE